MESPAKNKTNMKVKKVSLVEQVFQKMKEAIKNKYWKENEKLPSESELAEMYGVNRLTIRLALQQLNTLGVVETRVGEGTFVKKFNFLRYLDNASEFWTSPDLVDSVCDFRRVIEIESFRMAMDRTNPAELEELRRLMERYENLRTEHLNVKFTSPDSFQEIAEADYEFHKQICKMSHNSLLYMSFQMARDPIIQYLKMILQMRIEKIQSDPEYVWDHSDHTNLYYALVNKKLREGVKYYQHMVDYKIV